MNCPMQSCTNMYLVGLYFSLYLLCGGEDQLKGSLGYGIRIVGSVKVVCVYRRTH